MMRRSRCNGTPNIGIYASVNESLALVSPSASPDFIKDVEETLGVKSFTTTVSGAYVVGSLVAMNSYGAVVTEMIGEHELSAIMEHIPVTVIEDRINAAGNNILVNDKGAILNPDLGKRSEKNISDALGVEVVRAAISKCNTVGSVCCVNNKGCICNADVSDEDIELIESILKVEVGRASVNHGSKYLGAGILSNSKGALIGDDTTPIEMGKIEDGLVLY